MKQKNQIIAIIAIVVLGLLLVGAVGYITLDKYQQKQGQKQLTTFQQGAQAGYEQAVIQLFQQAATCQPVPIRVENQTMNIVAVECLKTK